jgi:ATP/maltotriose-dependent transcriptional regulator MalT
MNELNREYEAIPFFNRAIKVAKSTPDAGFPFMAYEGKANALVSLNRGQEAETLLKEALREARTQSKLGHETQLLILLGELARKTGHDEQAARYLEEASQRANKTRFYRMDAQAMSCPLPPPGRLSLCRSSQGQSSTRELTPAGRLVTVTISRAI